MKHTYYLKLADYNLRLCSILACLTILVFVGVQTMQAITYPPEKEILKKLAKTHGPARLKYLKELMSTTYGTPKQLHYLRQLHSEALQYDSLHIIANAEAELTCYFLNEQMTDSVEAWAPRAIKHSKQSQQWDLYYMAGNNYCTALAAGLRYDEAINIAHEMQEQARKSNDKQALAGACASLGSVYSKMRLYNEATHIFELEIQYYTEQTPTNITLFLQAYMDLLDNMTKAKLFHKFNRYHQEFDKLITYYRKNCNNTDGIADICHAFNQGYLLTTLVSQGKLAEVKNMLPTYFAEASKLPQYFYYLQLNTALEYYEATGEYAKGYAIMGQMIQLNGNMDEDIQNDIIKSRILLHTGHPNDAVRILEGGIIKRDSTFALRMSKALTYSNTQYNLQKLSDDNQQMREQQARTRLYAILGIVFLLFILLIFVCYHYYRQRLLLDRIKKSAEENKSAWQAAEEGSRLKSAFLQNVSHELHTPLNAIVGFSSLFAEKEGADEEEKVMAQLIQENSNQLLQLVDQLMEISTIESGNVKLKYQPCDLNQICSNVLQTINSDIKAGVSTQLQLAPTAPDNIMVTDSQCLQKIITNLAANAARFTETGSITISSTLDIASRSCMIRVSDTGCGIPTKDADRIFERFEKLNSFSQGFGLGLPICRLLTELLGGTIELDTTYTHGASFVVTLPLGQEKE